jgi:DNA replication protein DnaD
MNTEKLKLNLIQRMIKIEKPSTLERIEDLIVQEEMQVRTNESLEAIERGEFSTIDEFAKSNQKWLKKNSMK